MRKKRRRRRRKKKKKKKKKGKRKKERWSGFSLKKACELSKSWWSLYRPFPAPLSICFLLLSSG